LAVVGFFAAMLIASSIAAQLARWLKSQPSRLRGIVARDDAASLT
jgi:hypothetical protein